MSAVGVLDIDALVPITDPAELEAVRAMLRACSRPKPKANGMYITTYPVSSKPATQGQRIASSWDDIIARVASPIEEPNKSGLPGWSAATFAADYREKANVQNVYALGFDVDEEPHCSLSVLRDILLAPFAAIVHSTHSHTANAPRWRVWIKTSRPMTADEYERAWMRFRTTVLANVGVGSAAKDASRFWYMPGHAPGQPYEYAVTTGEPVDVDALLALPELPAPSPPPPPAAPPAARIHNRPDIITRAQAYLATADAAISGQHGHDTAFRIVERVVRGFDLSDDEALAVLGEWNARCAPPWSAAELRHKIQDGRARGDTPIGSLRDEAPKAKSAETSVAFRLWTPEQIWAPLPPPDHLFDGLLTRGSLGLIVAYGNSLKTWLLADAAMCSATGESWLGRFATKKPARGILIDFENGSYEMRRRVQRIARGRKLEIPVHGFTFVTMPEWNMTQEQFFTAVEALARDYQFIGIDSLAAGNGSVDENDARFAQPLYRLKAIAEKYNVVIVVVHHSPKGAGDRDERELVRGTGAIFNAVDVTLLLTPVKRGFVVRQTKARCGPKVERFVVRLEDVGPEATIVRSLDSDGDQEQAVELAASLDKTKAEVLRLLGKARDLPSKDAIYRRLTGTKRVRLDAVKEVIESGLVVMHEGFWRLASEVK